MLNPMDLTNCTILVTGASSGIGRETSVLLSQLGANLVLVARNTERLKETAHRLEGSGHQIEAFDLTAIDEIPQWLKSVTNKVGALHGLVHSAGTEVTLPVRLLKNKNIEDVMQINVNAAISLTKAMRQKGCYQPGSSIVFLSSAAALVGQAGLSAYSASKGAIVALTKSLAIELAKDKIRVNCVAPAYVKTEMIDTLQQKITPEQLINIEAKHPLGMGTPLDVAYAIAFLLGDTARWITGTTLVVDGGLTAY